MTRIVFHTAHLRVRADAVEPFKARLTRHAQTSVAAEPGCSRFDVHQERGDPTLFLLVECYDDDAAFQALQPVITLLALVGIIKPE